MENWDWCAGRSADEIGSYIAYALQILKNAGLHCDGITTPGNFGNGGLPELSRGVFQAVRSVYGGELPHYFRNLFDKGSDSVAPRVEFASRLQTSSPECVVSIYACTGDWTGNWDCSSKPEVDRFISPDLSTGRVVDVIERGEPAAMLCHWTGIYHNGQELGFRAMQEIVRRVNSRYKQVVWMKLADLARYWAARELTAIQAPSAGRLRLQAPYACPDFTLSWRTSAAPALVSNGKVTPLREVRTWQELEPGAWRREGDRVILCMALPKGAIEIQSKA
jgi:hypothetical protein